MAKEKTYTLTLSAQELHDLIEAALVCECQAAQLIGGLKRKGLDIIPCNWMDCIGVWVFSVFHLNYLFKFRLRFHLF